MNAWGLLADPVEYPTGIQLVVRGMCAQRPDAMSGLFAFLSTFLQGNYEGQRLAAAAALAEMVAHTSGKDQVKEKKKKENVCFFSCLFSSCLMV